MRAPKSFEEGMDRLNAILAQMQQEDTSLADSVKLYAEAASLMQYCHTTLEKTSLQIEEISAKIAETVEAPQEQEEEYWTTRHNIRTICCKPRLRWMLPVPVFCPRNRRYAEPPVTACWAAESASAQF